METSTIIGFILVILFVIFTNGRTRRIAREQHGSLKGRMRAMDRHHHDMINSNHHQVGKDFNRFLSLMGYKRMDLNHSENLVLVEDFKGRLFIANDEKGAKFVPVTELKPEKDTRTVEYMGKILIFSEPKK